MADFHLLRPWWLLLLALIPVLIWWWHRPQQGHGWHQLLPPHLAQVLVRDSGSVQRPQRWQLLLALLLQVYV